jgi:hypothetical protein
VEELNLTIFIITRLQKSVHHPINKKGQLSELEQQQQLSTHRAGATAQLFIHSAGATAAAVYI